MKRLLLCFAILLPSVVQAKINNSALSYIGFNVGEISYTESGVLSSGIYFETNPTTTNIFNYSGGYTPVGDNTGFYINTISTLSSSSNAENWYAQGEVSNGAITNSVDGYYQHNMTASAHNELEIMFAYIMQPKHQVVAGISYTRSLMDRNSFDDGAALDDFNQAHLTPAIGNDNVSDFGAHDANGNGVLELDELVDTYGAQPKQKVINFTETFSAVMLQAGYIFDSRFDSKLQRLRFTAGIIGGLPVYYDVVNTSNPSLSFSDSLVGYNVKTFVGLGWNFSPDYGVMAKLNYSYRHRDELVVGLGFQEELQRARSAKIPENELAYWNLGLTAFWNFQ